MEVLGLIIAASFGLVACPIYCLVLDKLVKRWTTVSAIAYWSAMVTLTIVVSELSVMMFFGITTARSMFGQAFTLLQIISMLLPAPAIGAVSLLGRKKLWWPITAGLCWLVGFSAILFNIYVSEALYGVDGQGSSTFDSTR